MPRNNGVYTLPAVYLAQDGDTIQPNQHNIPLQDIAQALTGSLPRDGSAAMTGDLPMNGRKVTGLGAATAPGDAVRLDQLPATSGWLSSVATLPMVADRIPYATGAASAALAVFTAAGRAIVGAADAAAQRVAIGLGALATKNKADVADIDATGTPSGSNYLRGDGAWSVPPMIGVGQTWQDVSSSRTHSTSYQNNTGVPIMVAIGGSSGGARAQASANGSSWVTVGLISGGGSDRGCSFIVPNGHYYRMADSGSIDFWSELR